MPKPSKEIMQERQLLLEHDSFKCIRCQEIKNISERCRSHTKGKTWKRGHCKVCERKRLRDHHVKFKNTATLEKVIARRVVVAKARAKKKKMAFDLDTDFLLELFENQDGLCYYSKIPMSWKSNDWYCFSIDRKNPLLGYTRDNVVLCCVAANYIKLDQDRETFKRVIEAISKNLERF